MIGNAVFGNRNVFDTGGSARGFGKIGWFTPPQYILFSRFDALDIGFDAFVVANGDSFDVILVAADLIKTMGFAKRQAFLFKDGKLVWLDLTAATDQQAADVLKFIESKG